MTKIIQSKQTGAKAKKLGHTTVYRGKKILVFFRSGEKLLTKFIEKKGRFIVTETGKWSTDEVYKISIYHIGQQY